MGGDVSEETRVHMLGEMLVWRHGPTRYGRQVEMVVVLVVEVVLVVVEVVEVVVEV